MQALKAHGDSLEHMYDAIVKIVESSKKIDAIPDVTAIAVPDTTDIATQAEWEAMVADFKATLNTFRVPQREQEELITIVGSTRNDIVHSPPSVSPR